MVLGCWGLLIKICVILLIFVSSACSVEVRLNLGQSGNQGRVEVRQDGQYGTWGTVCDLHFGQLEADTVCRQLQYKYARNDRDVYRATLPDFVLENVDCDGGENDLSECIKDEWKVGTGQCTSFNNNYAAVCCSNSPDFGEIQDGVFVSDCADFWLEAEETCESKQGTLASSELYATLVGTQDYSTIEKGFWTRRFFTPWLWGNGCFEVSNITSEIREFTVQNNSAQVCLQLCSIDGPTSFLVSENRCRCMTDTLKSSLTEVLPGYCNKRCVGNSEIYCGDAEKDYWNYYSIASEEDNFYRITDPLYNQQKQCAVINSARKLVTQTCFVKRGYICAQVDSSTNLIFFNDNFDSEVMMQEARYKCETSHESMHLVGERILTHDGIFQETDNLWVDVMSTLTDVFKVDPETAAGSEKASNNIRKLNPKWCLSRKLRDHQYRDEISRCQQDRLRYICELDSGYAGTTDKSGSSENTTGSTNYNESYTVTKVYDTLTSQPVQLLDIHSLLTIIISILCAVVLLILIAGLLFCWCKRSAKKGKGPFASFMKRSEAPKPDHHEIPQNEYQVTLHGSDNPNPSEEHIYNEILDPSKNIYNEVDTLLSGHETSPGNEITDEEIFNKPLPPEPIDGDASENIDNNGDNTNVLKEPVTIKRSYSSPKDLVNYVGGDPTNFNDPSYTYPYDKVQRSDDIKGDNSDQAGVDNSGDLVPASIRDSVQTDSATADNFTTVDEDSKGDGKHTVV